MASFLPPAAKTYTPKVEGCIAIDTAMLRKNGMLLEFMDHRLQRRWKLASSLVGDIFLSTTFTGDITCPSLQIDGTCFGQPVMQAVQLVSRQMRFGGKRWYFVCPQTKRTCCKLLLPPGAKAFASVKGWGLSYRSQYDDAVTRATKAIGALGRRSDALSKYARTRTRQAIQERLWAKEEFLYRVEQQCARDLSVGNRMSVRRACRVAVASQKNLEFVGVNGSPLINKVIPKTSR
jgi:hypothetical protein